MAQIATAALGHPRSAKKVDSTEVWRTPDPKASYETRHAFDKIRGAIGEASYAAFQLSERELLGLQQMIEEHIGAKGENIPIWQGVLADNVEKLKLMEARRTGSGEWIATVDVIQWKETENEGTTIKSWHEKHPPREAALEAAKRLARDNVSAMKANTSLEARVVSAPDWED